MYAQGSFFLLSIYKNKTDISALCHINPILKNRYKRLTYWNIILATSAAASFEPFESLSCRHVFIELFALHGVFLLLLELEGLEYLWILYAPLPHQLFSFVLLGLFVDLIC